MRGAINGKAISCHPKTPALLRLLDTWRNSPYFRGAIEEWVEVNPPTAISITDRDTPVSFLPMDAVNDSDGGYELQERTLGEVLTGYTRFAEGDMICAKITPCMQNGKAAVARGLNNGFGFGSTEFHVLRPKSNEIVSEFLLWALTTRTYRENAPAAFTGTAGQQRLPDSFLKSLPLPFPPLSVQQEMIDEMEIARASRRIKLSQANALLTSLDIFLLEHLGISVPETDNRVTYAIPFSTVQRAKQIGADYFHPERMNALRAIQAAKKASRAARLEEIADFQRDFTTKYKPEEYLGLAGVQSHTGELAEISDEPGKGQASLFKRCDVLFARLRPYLNKVWRAERDGVCSTEFHVIRIKAGVTDLLPDYLAAVLRSSIVVAQTRHMMTGNIHPRLANEDVVDLLIPIPDEKVQREIVDELRKRRLEARGLREKVAREWEAAKARFEARLQGGEAAR